MREPARRGGACKTSARAGRGGPTRDWAGPGRRADCGHYHYCIGNPYGFGWAVKGFAQDVRSDDAVPMVALPAPGLFAVDGAGGGGGARGGLDRWG